MANLFFPQLTSGALVQFPLKKTRVARTIQNILPDGSMVLFADPAAAKLIWQLSYQQLSMADLAALRAFFSACYGPLRAFTFIDPSDNMLVSSSDLTADIWQKSSLLNVEAGAADPDAGMSAFSILNAGQTDQPISQTLAVPAGYQYCLSVYVCCPELANIALTRQGLSAQATDSFLIGPSWTRVRSAGVLADTGTSLTVGVSVPAGQQVSVFGMQLEAQIEPSEFRPTGSTAGVYPNAHWGVDELSVSAEAPNLFATSFSIETSL